MPLKKKKPSVMDFLFGWRKAQKITVSVKLTVTFRAAAPER